MTEISIDCHLAKGVRLQNLDIFNLLPFCVRCIPGKLEFSGIFLSRMVVLC